MYKDKDMKQISLRVNKHVWANAGTILKEVGISRSSFIQIVLQGVVDTNAEIPKEALKNVAHKLIDKAKLKL